MAINYTENYSLRASDLLLTKMKVALLVIVVSYLSLTCSTLAAPVQLKMDSDMISAKTPLLKSLFRNVFLQQEQLSPEEEIEKATKFCSIFATLFKFTGVDRTGDFCDPKTVRDRSSEHESEREETYKMILNFLKNILHFDPDSDVLHGVLQNN